MSQLLITPDEIKLQIPSKNVDNAYLIPSIQAAQDIFVSKLLGSTLLRKLQEEPLVEPYLSLLNDYVKPFLLWKTLSMTIPGISMKLRNAGVVQNQGDHVNPVGIKEMTYLQEHYESLANYYADRCSMHLCANYSLYPEYTKQTNDDDVRPGAVHHLPWF